MSQPEIIDLTDSPAHAIINGVDKHNDILPEDDKNTKKKTRKRKRKKDRTEAIDGPQSQVTSTANTRSNSEERSETSQGSQHTRQQTKRRREQSSKQDETLSSAEHLEKEPVEPSNDLFFLDITPVHIPSPISKLPSTAYPNIDPQPNVDEPKLLLPAHVSILGSTPVEILPPVESDEEGDKDYIKYLDYGGGRKEFLRYFETPEDETMKLSRTVCKHCGAEGDHKTADCRVLICLTCGIRDEHATRACPVSKVCFTCGMKGHINANCPNRHKGRNRDIRCGRCGSDIHQTSECPTWWRLYEYVTDEDKEKIMTERRSKRELKLGQGGESYIAEDEWCYNCGEPGHWGDDCDGPTKYDKPTEPSAFGVYNISTGPFFDANESNAPSKEQRQLRDWEREEDIGDWGKFAPDNVGKLGKRKMMDKLRKSAQRYEEAESDPDDWFGSKNVKLRGTTSFRAPIGPDLHRERDRERDRDRDWDRRRNRERGRGYDRQRERERGRENDKDRRYEQERDRERDREKDREKDRERDRERDRRREQDRERESRDKGKEKESQNYLDKNQSSRSGADDKPRISFSKTIGQGRQFNAPPPSLPDRPDTSFAPRLLSRISDAPSQNTSSTLSIKGASRNLDNRQSGGDRRSDSYRGRRDNSGPRYRGGYAR